MPDPTSKRPKKSAAKPTKSGVKGTRRKQARTPRPTPPSAPGVERGGYDYRFVLAARAATGELDAALDNPMGPSFEIVDGRLIAMLRTPIDIRGVQHLLEVFDGMEPDRGRRGERPFVPPPPGVPFLRVRLDVTPYLPAILREFMADHGEFLRRTREFSALEEPPDANDSEARHRWERAFDTFVSMRDDPSNNNYNDRALVARIKESGRLYTSGRAAALRKAWNANCHEFSALLLRSAYPDEKSDTLSDHRQLRATRPLAAAEARVGDIVMFFAHGLDDPETRARGGLIHSALVIRVSAPKEELIEVLEKQDPIVAMSTRTVAEIRDYYAAKHRGTAITTEIRFYRCPHAAAAPGAKRPQS